MRRWAQPCRNRNDVQELEGTRRPSSIQLEVGSCCLHQLNANRCSLISQTPPSWGQEVASVLHTSKLQNKARSLSAAFPADHGRDERAASEEQRRKSQGSTTLLPTLEEKFRDLTNNAFQTDCCDTFVTSRYLFTAPSSQMMYLYSALLDLCQD